MGAKGEGLAGDMARYLGHFSACLTLTVLPPYQANGIKLGPQYQTGGPARPGTVDPNKPTGSNGCC